MTRDEFDKYYSKEINQFKTSLISEKEKIKIALHDKFKTDGYGEAISNRESELKKKV